MIKFKFFNALTIALILLQAVLPIPALAMANTAGQQDYAPGSVVTISGDSSDGFAAGENVQVEVSGPNGLSLSCDATADDNGAWSCDVTVPSDESAAGDYSYTATGETSGASQSGSFTVTAPPPPTVEPTQEPTQEPTVEPTSSPTVEPTSSPTVEPTLEPSATPTASPTEEPRLEPTDTPTSTPTRPVLTPFITSDKDDYFAGELVTLTSGNWQPNESVHLVVNDVLGDSWRLSEDVSADSYGAFVYKFNLPNWFVAQYHVYAYGAVSGSTTWDFTDSRTINSVTLNAGSSVSVSPGASITAVVSVTTSTSGGNTWNSTSWQIGSGAVTCVNHGDHNANGTFTETLTITAPTVAGTYNATFIAGANDSCGGNTSTPFTLTNGVTVNPGALNGFAVTNTSDANIGTQTAGVSFNIKVRAVDAFGNTVPGFTGGSNKVSISSTGTLSAGSGTTAAFVNGVLASHSVIISNSGTFTITATKNPSGPESGTSNSFTVNAPACTTPSVTTQPTSQTVTYGAASIAFSAAASGTAPTVQWQVSTGGPFSDISGATSTTFTINNPTVSQSGNQYRAVFTNACGTATSNAATLTVNNKTVTPSIVANNKVYDGTTTATLSSQTLTGVIAADTSNVGLSVGAASFADKNVGNGKTVTATGLTLTGSAAGNYQLSSTSATTTANITARALTVSATGVNKVYDGTTSATVTLSDNRIVGDTLSTSYATASFANKNVGSGKTISVTGISVSGSDSGNYTFNTTASAAADITALALTITATGVSKVYDGNSSATVTLSDNRLVGDLFTDSYTNASFADKNVGTGETVSVSGISISGADAGNYTLNTSASTTADITARGLTVTATGLDKVYDGTTAATVDLSNDSVSGDVFTNNYTTAAFTNKNVGTGKTINISGISISGTDAGNYNLLNTAATTTANIASLGVTASITASDKVYDGTDAATFSCSLSGIVSGEDVSCSAGAATFDNKNVGNGKTVTTTGLSLDGDDAGNYALTNTSATDTADITPLALTGSITAADKIYDGTTAATILTRTLSGVISGDDVSYVGGTASFDNKNLGTGKIVTATGLSLDGDDSGNYTVNSTATTAADITARPLTISAAGVNKVYDGTTAATVTLSDNRVSGDVFTDSYTSASFADKNVGMGKSMSITGISLSGADAGNYTFNTTASATADITARDLTVTATADDKVYDGTITVVAHLSDDRISGDTLTASYTSASFADKNVGTAKTVSVSGISISGADSGNYNLLNITASATADITQRDLTVSATGIGKVYDGTTTATVTLSDDKVSGDDVTDAYTSASFADKNVGTAKTVSVSGISISGADAGNYNLLNTTSTTTANIASLEVTASITASDKVYDGTDAATFSCSLSGIVSGEDVSCTGGSATFEDKNVGNGKTVTASGFSLSGADAGNYAIFNASASDIADITALAITGSITAADKIYDGTTAATILTRTLSGGISGDDVSYVGGTASFDNKNVGTNKIVTATGLGLSGADAGNYTVNNTATATADITPKALTASITANDKTYDGNDSATFTCDLIDVIGLDDVNCTGGIATFDNKNAGTDKVVTATGLSLDGDDAGNYTVNGTATTTADITARTLMISATGINKVYDGTATASVTLSDDRVSGDVFTDSYTSAAFSDKNVGTGKTVSVSGISISGTDAGNYTFNTSASTTADITARALTINATGLTKVYDGTTVATVTLSDNRVSGDVFTDSYTSAAFSDKNVGTDKDVSVSGISISGADTGNYTFNTIATTTADITVRHLTVTAQGINKVYDSTTAATVTLSDNRVSGDVFTDSYTSASFADKDAETGKAVSVIGILISGTDAGNYTFNTTATTAADITPRDLTVTATGVNKLYDGTTAATVTVSDDKVSGDEVTDTYTTAAFADKNVGTGKAVSVNGISISGNDAGNYNLLNTIASTTADITARALTITAHGVNKVYDGATAATVTLTDDRVAGDALSTSYTSASFADKNVGTGKTVSVSGLSISGADAANYTFNTTASTTADITARALTISAAGINKVYDSTTNATVTLSDNRVSGDVFSDSYTNASFGDKNVGTGKTVSVNGVSISGTDAGNYTFNTTASTTADITARDLTVSATGVNKVYDGTMAATVTLSDNRVSGDVFTDSYTSASFADKNAGTGKTVSVSGISISGTDAGNYNLLNTTATTTTDITARTLTISATGVNKVYDGTTNAAVTLSDDRVSGDVFTDSYTSASFTNKNVGTGKTVNVSGISISGTDTGNYTFNTTATATADITARDLTVTATADNKVYDGTTSAVAHLSDNRVAGDLFTDSYISTSFADKNVGSGKTVSVSGISISGTDAGNYNLLNTTASATADITPRPVTVTADPQTKVYGSSDPALTYQVTSGSVISGDSFSGLLNRAAGENVGSYAINQNTLALSSNYTLTYIGANLSITKATLTVTADNKSRVYGDPNPTFTASYSGFKNGETLANSGVTGSPSLTTVATATSPVGSYTITAALGTLASGNYSFTFINGTLTVSTWTPKGFYQPVDMNGVWNTVKNGSTVPLKFEIFAGSTELTDVTNVKTISVAMVACTVGTEDAIETLASATGGTELRYDTTAGQFIFNWKTPTTANKCYRVTMMTIDDNGTTTPFDGSTLVAYFKLK